MSREIVLGHADRRVERRLGSRRRSDEYACEAIANADSCFPRASSGQGIMAHMPPPDALIVDEAAQALESEVIVAFAGARGGAFWSATRRSCRRRRLRSV